MPCSATCADYDRRTQRINQYTQVTNGRPDVKKVKEALKRGPLMATLKIFEDFLAYKSGVYKHAKGPKLGSHTLMIIGFDDGSKSWIVRNSWGPGWGENGFGRLSYDNGANLGDHTWGFETAAPEGQVFIRSPKW